MGQSYRPGMKELWDSSQLYGGSAGWLESMYESYLKNPNTIEPRWRQYFDALPVRAKGNGEDVTTDVSHEEIRAYFKNLASEKQSRRCKPDDRTDLEHERKQVRVLQLINAYRFRGHQHARINPLHKRWTQGVAELALEYHELSENDFNTEFETGSLVSTRTLTLKDIYETVLETYCGSIGVEYMHIVETAEKRWIQQRMEGSRGKIRLSNSEKHNILQQLTDAEGLEKYLHTRYVGQKRFSLEGGESLIPMLDELVMRAGAHGVKEVVIGMAHRGRLNVLVNVLGKTPAELFSEFEGTKAIEELTGDVKYHLGFASNMDTSGGPVHLALAFNPSHLEIVAPVVEGSVRARQWRRGDRDGAEVIPVQIHGDAAFSGQGVVMETLQMSQSRGYSTKGTVHIIINNQIGFTTSFRGDVRSTYYCTDVAKMVDAPIFHVNGDDPEAVVMVTRMALDYRMTFNKDVVIDMMCYRRHGHNEADEPKATQPMMYSEIGELQTTRTLYAEQLIHEGAISKKHDDQMVQRVRQVLEAGDCVVPHKLPDARADRTTQVNWKPYTKASILDDVKTSVPLKNIRRIQKILEVLPAGFELHNRVAKVMEDREKMCAGALPIDWGYAETLAYATLVDEGYSVRLSGQDSGRGTFFHRHAVVHNQVDGSSFVPLRAIGNDKDNFLVIDSLLSELAVLAFEYGFSTAEPTTLTLWEAQFGDFANGAQVVIDQFISAGEHKWGRVSGLVMLLPHGYEGQGAEHSSARLERYLQLCSVHNMQVCVPSTPAQMFHLLRRQMVRNCRKPLIVMTPKSLLRNKACVSTLEDLTQGGYQWVIPEIDKIEPEKVKRVIVCAGKIYYELLERRRQEKIDDIAILRLEQIYPLPGKQLNELLSMYANTNDLLWCQEEPKNQGAWDFIQPRLAAMLDKRWVVNYTGRQPSSAPAVGSAQLHALRQKEILQRAFSFEQWQSSGGDE
ncbi:MAG: 2-oxoglutarate dehydrogenase E1 component [Gammaproteobacteria bacterium]